MTMGMTFWAFSNVVVGCFDVADVGETGKSFSSASSLTTMFSSVKYFSVFGIDLWMFGLAPRSSHEELQLSSPFL